MDKKKTNSRGLHIIILHKKHNDNRRHKSNCQYYQKESKICECWGVKCIGSAHCTEYKEHKNGVMIVDKDDAISSIDRRTRYAKIPFNGIKKIKMCDIVFLEKAPPSPTKNQIALLVEQYHKNNRFNQPVVVQCFENKYLLVGGLTEYSVGKMLGMKEIEARCSK